MTCESKRYLKQAMMMITHLDVVCYLICPTTIHACPSLGVMIYEWTAFFLWKVLKVECLG